MESPTSDRLPAVAAPEGGPSSAPPAPGPSVEEALRRSEARLHLALEAGRMGTWEFDVRAGTVRWSPTLERIHGLEEGTFPGTFEAYQSDIHPEDREGVLATIGESLSGRAPHHLEYRIVRPDGVTRWVEARGQLFTGSDGRPERMMGVCMDVTERKEMEAQRDAALAEAERARRELQEVLKEAPASITVTHGEDHLVVMQNDLAREIAGRDLAGRSLREELPRLGVPEVVALYDDVYRSGRTFVGSEFHLEWQDPAGAPREGYFNFVMQPLRDAEGATSGLLSHSVEVTELVLSRQEVEEKAAELARVAAALERSNRELDQFAYVASHDLKAPLRAIANLSQWLEEDLGSRLDGESRRQMDLLRSRVHRMEGLIDGILHYSRAGRLSVASEPVEVAGLLREVVELLAPAPPRRVEWPEGLPVLVTGRLPLQQVFLNLIGNALKHGGEAVQVRVGHRQEGNWHHFTVGDDGPGIAPEFQDRIWGLFQTLRPRDEVEGTGIGLSLVRKLVENRGGRAWVESEPGRGTAFHFTWPGRAEAPPP